MKTSAGLLRFAAVAGWLLPLVVVPACGGDDDGGTEKIDNDGSGGSGGSLGTGTTVGSGGTASPSTSSGGTSSQGSTSGGSTSGGSGGSASGGSGAGGTSSGGSAAGGTASETDGGMAGAGGDPGEVDYTMCSVQECDADAELDFDFSGEWTELIVFESNDCDPSLQPLLPEGFMLEGAHFFDVIEGNCIRPAPESDKFTGSISKDLSGAAYCTESSLYVESQDAEIPLVSHVTWDSIEPGQITGTTAVYVTLAGCTMQGTYSLTRTGDGGE